MEDLAQSGRAISLETVRRLRPLARRRFRVSRPPLELIRSRKPCLFRRFRLLGWKVRFTMDWLLRAGNLGRSGRGCLCQLVWACQGCAAFGHPVPDIRRTSGCFSVSDALRANLWKKVCKSLSIRAIQYKSSIFNALNTTTTGLLIHRAWGKQLPGDLTLIRPGASSPSLWQLPASFL
jgi:hypothetical protein